MTVTDSTHIHTILVHVSVWSGHCCHEVGNCVILHMYVITQNGDSPLIWAASSRTEMVVELMDAEANLDLQNNVWSRFFIVHVYIHTHML